MGLYCKWCPSPLLQSQFLTFEGYCPLPFVQLYRISTRRCMISAKELVCWLMPVLTSTSLLPLISPFPGRRLNRFWAWAKGHLEVAVVWGNLILSSRPVQALHCWMQFNVIPKTQEAILSSKHGNIHKC